jgi:hypothetical protein
MEVISFLNLPGCGDRELTGVSFTAKNKRLEEVFFFWVPSNDQAKELVFKWVEIKGSRLSKWKAIAVSGLSSKRRSDLMNFWQSETVAAPKLKA